MSSQAVASHQQHIQFIRSQMKEEVPDMQCLAFTQMVDKFHKGVTTVGTPNSGEPEWYVKTLHRHSNHKHMYVHDKDLRSGEHKCHMCYIHLT